MSDKFTIRDFLVYLLTGLYLLLLTLFKFKGKFYDFFSLDKDIIKDNSAVVVALLLPGLYILGHVIQGLDDMLFKSTKILSNELRNCESLIVKIILFPVDFVFKIFLYHRITTVIKEKEINIQQFWKNCNKLIVSSKYDKSEYWHLLHTLFEGITFASFFWTFYCLYDNKVNGIFYFIISLIFWLRTRQMAENFITNVINTIEVLNEAEQNPIPTKVDLRVSVK